MINRRHVLALLLIVVSVVCLSCTSTGNDEHPVKFIGWHQLAYGHDKFTPQEKDENICRFRNRLPDGRKSGFSKICRRSSVGTGINLAMAETGCVISMCREAIHHWHVTKEGIVYLDMRQERSDLDH